MLNNPIADAEEAEALERLRDQGYEMRYAADEESRARALTRHEMQHRAVMVNLAARVYWEVIGPAAVEVARVLHTELDISTAGDTIVKLARQMDAYRRDG